MLLRFIIRYFLCSRKHMVFRGYTTIQEIHNRFRNLNSIRNTCLVAIWLCFKVKLIFSIMFNNAVDHTQGYHGCRKAGWGPRHFPSYLRLYTKEIFHLDQTFYYELRSFGIKNTIWTCTLYVIGLIFCKTLHFITVWFQVRCFQKWNNFTCSLQCRCSINDAFLQNIF